MDDQATASDYTDPMSDELLGRAADVLRSFGSAFGGRHLAVVGGAVPSLLVGTVPAGMDRHVGTADLDLHLSLHLLDGETADYYDAIIDGLKKLGLRADEKDGRAVNWRWIGTHRGAQMQVELLCPTRERGGRPERPADQTPAVKNIGPAKEIAALSVGYGHLVPDDTVLVERSVETLRGRLDFEFPVAGVASWLCLKADAIMRRDKPKDAYDVVWLIAGLGPDVAAERCSSSPLMGGPYHEDAVAQLRRLARQFAELDSIGPQSYVAFMNRGPAENDGRFAAGAVAEFFAALRREMPELN